MNRQFHPIYTADAFRNNNITLHTYVLPLFYIGCHDVFLVVFFFFLVIDMKNHLKHPHASTSVKKSNATFYITLLQLV
jgi:hypothetical protein